MERSSGVHLSLKNFLAPLSLITMSMASNFPLPFLPLTLTPWTLGRFHQEVGMRLSQNPKFRQHRNQLRASATFASGVSANPTMEGRFPRREVNSLRSQMDASASASNPRN